ncbi:hypothetical protein [Aquiflexum lacus]|uniref:hypothetical protein n=1 Tax=Aquiflexum lacus TaxID=2483805 RepID=UPI001E397A50|nr:hypothetical protein [Aquiflexum lacus]
MKKFKPLGVVLTLFFASTLMANAQEKSKLRPAHVGVYHSGLVGQVAIGTDLNQKYFGDIRFQANDILETSFGIEGSLNRNLVRDDWFNFHIGFMVGYHFNDNMRIGVPIGFTIMPCENHKRFAILMEASPNVFLSNDFFNLRANIGLRYTFRKQ